MAPRSKPATAGSSPERSNYERSPDSSPDPLQASFTSHNPRARSSGVRASKSPQRSPQRSTSPSKHNRGQSLSELLQFSSPSKSMILNTGKAGDASPWRIKVTVQAEPGDGEQEMPSPTVKRVERRKTTTVPLKGGDDASSPAKRRGRPRKSDVVEASANVRRPPTPVRKRRPSASPKKAGYVGGSDASAAAPPKRPRGRPRKSIQPEDILATDDINSQEEPAVDTATAAPRSSPPLLDLPAVETTSAMLQETPLPKSILKGSSLLPSSVQPKGQRGVNFDTPEQASQRKPVKERRGTPHAKIAAPVSISSDDDNEVDTPSDSDDEPQGGEATIAFESQVEAIRRGDGRQSEDAAFDPFDQGTARFPEDTTMFESENFSMISVDSLPSLRNPTPVTATEASALDKSYLKLGIAGASSSQVQETSGKAPKPKPSFISLPKATFEVQAARLQTPAVDMGELSEPPPIEQTQTHADVGTPLIGSTLKAGFKLQGLVDGNRVATPPIPQEGRVNMDGLFGGFSSDTRRELSDGLRLGQQLAAEDDDGRTSRRTTPARSSPNRPTPSPRQAQDHVFRSPGGQQNSRLLTPEDQDQYALPVPPAPVEEEEDEDPSFKAEEIISQLVSPDLSDMDEMSWKADTPPVRAESSKTARMLTAVNEEGEELRGPDIFVEAKHSNGQRVITATDTQGAEISGPDILVVADEESDVGEKAEGKEKEHMDIWSEEASRSLVDGTPVQQHPKEKEPKLYDFFGKLGAAKPVGGRLSYTSRRRYSDENEENKEPSQQLTPSSPSASSNTAPTPLDKGKGRMREPEEQDFRSDFTTGSDDTGIFFQPQAFKHQDLRERKGEKLGMSLLLDDGESLNPESSPMPVSKLPVNRGTEMHSSPAVIAAREAAQLAREAAERAEQIRIARSSDRAKAGPSPLGKSVNTSRDEDESIADSQLLDDGKSLLTGSSPSPATISPVNTKPNPFKATPPQFIAQLLTAPVRSSPLRQEYRASDSEESLQHSTTVEESTFPLSSPFHTQVDVTNNSIASHENQFRHEMEGNTNTSLLILREEADAYTNAYDPQHRSLHEITEVTEPSRSRIMYPSSPPERMSTREDNTESLRDSTLLDDGQSLNPDSSRVDSSIIRPRKNDKLLFSVTQAPASPKPQVSNRHLSRPLPTRTLSFSKPTIAVAPRTPEEGSPAQAPTGLFNRLTTTLFGATKPSTSTPPPSHPITAKYTPLPKTKPWTKTHYKTLDTLYQRHKLNPLLFSLDPLSAHASANTAILSHFLSSVAKNPYLNSRYKCWGYSVVMSEEMLVLCAVYMSLLTLADVGEYEEVVGKSIEMGDCNPGTEGAEIDDKEVVKRLATVVMGEGLRADEKRGVVVRRTGGLAIEWAGWGGQVVV